MLRSGRAGPGRVKSLPRLNSWAKMSFCFVHHVSAIHVYLAVALQKSDACHQENGDLASRRSASVAIPDFQLIFIKLGSFPFSHCAVLLPNTKPPIKCILNFLLKKKTSLRGLENSLRKLPYRWPICNMCSQRCNIRSGGAFLPRAFSMVNFVESLRISLLGDNLSELFFMHCQRAVIVYHGPCCQ